MTEMIYLDTNAFYAFFFEKSEFFEGVKKIFDEMQKGKRYGLTSCLTLDELAYVILMRLIKSKYAVHPAEKIRKNPEVVLEFAPKIKEVFEVMFSFDNLEIADADGDLAAVIPELLEKGILPRDSIHYQTMKLYDCKKILSTDADFDKLNDIQRIRPEQLH
ncbi:type II toxin-antitoxin system VapC family toxin [Candidatus Woesearchaeota archaeon]|nr:type II toxin-antitoxin system VapC family toxin [Candidatus Woesearchaeota archaeon]